MKKKKKKKRTLSACESALLQLHAFVAIICQALWLWTLVRKAFVAVLSVCGHASGTSATQHIRR